MHGVGGGYVLPMSVCASLNNFGSPKVNDLKFKHKVRYMIKVRRNILALPIFLFWSCAPGYINWKLGNLEHIFPFFREKNCVLYLLSEIS